MPKKTQLFYVTGTFHGSHVYAASEGEARRIFHKFYNGESIIELHTLYKIYQKLPLTYYQ